MTQKPTTKKTLNLPSLALIIKPIQPINILRLMIAPEHKKVLRILNLIRQQQTNRLQILLAPVHIIPQKQIIRLGRIPSKIKNPQQIVILSMNVPTNLQGPADFYKGRLVHEDFAGDDAKGNYLVFFEIDGFARGEGVDREEGRDDVVDVEFDLVEAFFRGGHFIYWGVKF